jgi:hypothetical protein
VKLREGQNIRIFLGRHLKRLEKGVKLRLMVRWYGVGRRKALDTWGMERRDGRLGIIGKGPNGVLFNDKMAERFKNMRREWIRLCDQNEMGGFSDEE